ncbi:enkurin [Cephus cinctus]|uniref:Enkurin n=1 Tax=Cephus cinctus TaxID=211228 RepID=A0AAJ7REH5_CEPCN|nr:enkurin [Cephus cinctus]
MSFSEVIHCNENIKSLIPKPEVTPPASPRYESKYHRKVTKERARSKSAHRTLGVPSVTLNPPSEYLKKRTRVEPRRDDVKHVHYHRPDYQHKLPSWERIKKQSKSEDDLPALPQDPLKTGRINFPKQNIINVKKSKAKQPRMRYVDTRFGDAHDLVPSGLLPSYLYRKDYGKPPKYVLEKFKQKSKTVKSDKDGQGSSVSLDVMHPKCRYVTAPERANLLYGMKKRWEEMTKEFQCLPFLTDTLPKVKRKTKLENDLRQLEKDIDIIERHPYIYVYSDTEEES